MKTAESHQPAAQPAAQPAPQALNPAGAQPGKSPSPLRARLALPLLLTMGDAAGIGPECLVRAHADGAAVGCVVVGDVGVMRRAAALLKRPLITAQIESLADADAVPPGCLPVLQPPGLPAGLAGLPWGQVSAEAGAAAARCIEFAVSQIQAGQACGLVTAPLHKEALAAAGIHFPGHTEMLQSLAAKPQTPGSRTTRSHAPRSQASTATTHMPPVRMMLANEELRVVLVTIHQSLRSAVDAVTFEAVLKTIQIAHAACAHWGLTQPRIAVAGLNPHAGEGGLFGDEEIRIIAPAIQAARALGIQATGPHAPDTVFMRARHTAMHPGEFDLVVAMTHDQGLIPVKYLGVEQGVNITLGLPFVRTSPDHGTAFDIAGQGLADARSLVAAITAARRLLRPSPGP